jgi:hypothetical protein
MRLHKKAHGRRRGPFHAANVRKARENADATRRVAKDEKPRKPATLRGSSTRLKIAVSPVRVRVSPSPDCAPLRDLLAFWACFAPLGSSPETGDERETGVSDGVGRGAAMWLRSSD